MGGDFQVKIMGGAGLTSNLDRPNMPGGNCLNCLKGNHSSVRMVTVFFAAATLTMPVCIDRSRPPKREGETKEERLTLILKVKA